MKIWAVFLKILVAPGKFVVRKAPKMDPEATRLLENMTNYIFWLTPSIGVLTWLVIRHAISVAP